MFDQKQYIESSKFIDLLQKDGVKAFELLFKLYYDKLLHLAKYYTNNAEDAEEIVQDVFLKLWEGRKKITKLNNSYLFTMTKNGCLDYLKHQSIVLKKSKELYDNQLADPLRFIQNETASYILEKELDQKIQESIAALPTKQREVFVKSRMDGKKNMEIAQELKISKRTVDTHITLALKAMRLQLKEFLMLML
ncbi:RNA polymerase sigma-70 factor [Echinicola soli]|uniref:RNA polymerase sigma-70 factor n=1 Tax=Echinicola soli TaxID=2591634 RepID=A0A514CKK7_9BACT|nr:RNA polymerase sigma-70 factor [Echinicola soli]QDH80363.1 RNA polymerase sigma-70 factor [Echinicola soli]